MTAFNVVRFRVKPGREDEFVAAHRNASVKFSGSRRVALIKTGERTYCIVGEWTSAKKLAAARPKMISVLDTFRDCLEDLGDGLGVTDPVSGEVVYEPKRAQKSKRGKAAKPKKRMMKAQKTKKKGSKKVGSRKKPTR
jgi:quinol monooxygenase YgiN